MEINTIKMAFVDPFMLTVTLVMTVLLILGNMYFVAHYSHHADNGFGSSAACKFIIVSIIPNNHFYLSLFYNSCYAI